MIIKLERPFYAKCPCGSIEYYIIVDKPDFSKLIALKCVECKMDVPIYLKLEVSMWQKIVAFLWTNRTTIQKIITWVRRKRDEDNRS